MAEQETLFPEGIRAMVVDKDKTPLFAPLGEDELEFLSDPCPS